MSSPTETQPVAKPLSAYVPMPNSHRTNHTIRICEMPPQPAEATYRLLPDSESGFPKPENNAAESGSSQTTRSTNDHYQARGVYKYQ